MVATTAASGTARVHQPAFSLDGGQVEQLASVTEQRSLMIISLDIPNEDTQ